MQVEVDRGRLSQAYQVLKPLMTGPLAKRVHWGEASLRHHRQFCRAMEAAPEALDDMIAEGLSWRQAFARLRDT